MLGASRIFCIVPAFNEALAIDRVIATMPPFVDTIFLVDDASHDETVNVAQSVGDPRLIVLRHSTNRGVGAAILTGYTAALSASGSDRDAFVVMAGDGQMDPRDLRAVVAPILNNAADYVKGDRFREQAIDVAMPLARRIGGKVFSALTGFAIGQTVSDSQCGYTALARSACAALPLSALYTGYGYPNDLLSMCTLHGLRIQEVPIRAVYAGEASGLRLRHLPRIAFLVGRAAIRRLALRSLRKNSPALDYERARSKIAGT